MKRADYELIEGTNGCYGCVFFDGKVECVVGMGTDYFAIFKDCWEDVGIILDDDYPDLDEGIYLIWAKK